MTNTELQRIVERLSKKKEANAQASAVAEAPAPVVKKRPVALAPAPAPIPEVPTMEEAEEEYEEEEEVEEYEEEPEPTPAPAPRPAVKKVLRKVKVTPKIAPAPVEPVQAEQPEGQGTHVSEEEMQLAQQLELLQNDGRFRYLLLNELQKLNSGIFMLYKEISKVTGGEPDAEGEATA